MSAGISRDQVELERRLDAGVRTIGSKFRYG